jgi:hypothetical protein
MTGFRQRLASPLDQDENIMALKTKLAISITLLLAGCAAPYSPTPLVANAPLAKEDKLQAVAHWKAISAHIEKQLEPAIRKTPNIPLYVEPAQYTAFNQTMASQLITSLVNDGYVVGKTPVGALKVEIDTQVVAFSAERPQYVFAGQRSDLMGGAWVITNVNEVGAPAAAPADTPFSHHDAYSWFRSEFDSGVTPKTEIVLTISVSDERRYYARSTSVYYVTDSDRYLYEIAKPVSVKDQPPPPTPLTKIFTVRGS